MTYIRQSQQYKEYWSSNTNYWYCKIRDEIIEIASNMHKKRSRLRYFFFVIVHYNTIAMIDIINPANTQAIIFISEYPWEQNLHILSSDHCVCVPLITPAISIGINIAIGMAMITAQYQSNPMEMIAKINATIDIINAIPVLGRLISAIDAALPNDKPMVHKIIAITASIIFIFQIPLFVSGATTSPSSPR